ncbi:EAL domain-containing protein [Massilia sp. PAMC28688]|nr:EAL domain-containing protein [Massilia sp. PAMC28688]
MDAAGDIALRLDASGTVAYASARSRRALDLAPGMSLLALAHDDDQARLRAALQACATGHANAPTLMPAHLHALGKATCYELRLSRLAEGDEALLLIGRDISTQNATEQRLRHQATHDALTGLPNRLLLSDRIRMALARSRRLAEGFAVVSIGLDGFRKVNDGLGHTAGDAVLRQAAARLRKTLRDSDTLARAGGDEFIALLPATHSEAQVKLVTGRLLAALQPAFEAENHAVYIGASVGVALYPEHAEDEARLIALADAAMAMAKQAGKARCVVYSAPCGPDAEHDISLEAAMFSAVREGEFMLFYQPIVDASTREIQGFETLMRWKHPTLGLVPPARFIPIAETNGLINLLGAWALRSACMQLKQFEAACGRKLYMSVNISPRQFRSDHFLKVLDEALAFSGVDGRQLVLEITEGTLMLDPAHAEAVLVKMAERGARIAIDDFGTGYSSLAYLKRFPISVLKVDRAFVKDLPASCKDGAICSAVLDLARHLELSVVAEGVETEDQLRFLDRQGCHYVQGYLTGRPMPAHVALAALTDTYNELRTGLA